MLYKNGMDIAIEKAWDGNECVTEYNNRVYVSRGRWQWVLIVDGSPYACYDTKREAKFYADKIAREGQS